MIQRQIDLVWEKLTKQSQLLFKKCYRGHYKRRFIDSFADKVGPVVPNVSREDIYLIITGFVAELRSLPSDIRETIIAEENSK